MTLCNNCLRKKDLQDKNKLILFLTRLNTISGEEIHKFIEETYSIKTNPTTIKAYRTQALKKFKMNEFYQKVKKHICRLTFDVPGEFFDNVKKDKSLQAQHEFYLKQNELGYPQDFEEKFEKYFNISR